MLDVCVDIVPQGILIGTAKDLRQRGRSTVREGFPYCDARICCSSALGSP